LPRIGMVRRVDVVRVHRVASLNRARIDGHTLVTVGPTSPYRPRALRARHGRPNYEYTECAGPCAAVRSADTMREGEP
jgi:hypothetical protein